MSHGPSGVEREVTAVRGCENDLYHIRYFEEGKWNGKNNVETANGECAEVLRARD